MRSDKMTDEQEEVLYSLLTELEKVGCFEIETNDVERRKVAKVIVETIRKGSEGKLHNQMSGRWL